VAQTEQADSDRGVLKKARAFLAGQ
jgi:hypothetical protein